MEPPRLAETLLGAVCLQEGLSLRPLLGSFALLLVLFACAPAGDTLPQLGIDIDKTSVSGLSAGAYMAGQLQVAITSLGPASSREDPMAAPKPPETRLCPPPHGISPERLKAVCPTS